LLSLARTNDAAFNKILITFCALSEEVSFLRATAEKKFYAQLILFGHSKNDDAEQWSEGLLESQMGIVLPLLQDAANFVRRVNSVVAAIVAQVRALFSRGAGFLGGFAGVKLSPVVLALADALRVLITLDAVVRGSRLLGTSWEKYKRLADIMRSDPSKYGADANTAGDFDNLLQALDAGFMRGDNFQRCLDQRFEGEDDAEVNAWLRGRTLEALTGALSVVGSDSETTETRDVVGLFAVYALYRALSSGRVPPEPLVADFKKLWKVIERVPFVALWGGKIMWLPDEFLATHLAVAGIQPSKLVPRDPRIVRDAAADSAEASLPALTNTVHARLVAWLVRARAAFSLAPLGASDRTPPGEVLKARALLLTQAVVLAHMAGRTLESFIALTLFLERPIKRRCVEPVARLAEVCKSIEGALRGYAAPIAETLPSIVRDANAALVALMAPLQLRAGAAKAKMMGDPVARFITSATAVVTDLCTSTEAWSPPRRLMLELALSITTQTAGIAKAADIDALGRTTWTLRVLSNYNALVREAADTSCLYWVREIVPALFGVCTTIDGTAPLDRDSRAGSRLAFLAAALSDAARWLSSVVHLPPPPPPARRITSDALIVSELSAGARVTPSLEGLAGVEHPLTAFERYVNGVIMTDLITPLARAVETDLRINIHAVHLAHMDPPSLRGRGPPLVHLLACPPFRVVSALVDIRSEVTRYLEKTFYELTTIALHDWKTCVSENSLACVAT
jgi:WASH complex subunit 7